jgi:hypothetical protein
MNAHEGQTIDETKAAFLAKRAKDQTRAALLCLLTGFLVYVMPRLVPAPFGPIMMAFGGAASFSVFFLMFPQTLRSRSGSLKPALCFLAFVWLCAAISILFQFTNRH